MSVEASDKPCILVIGPQLPRFVASLSEFLTLHTLQLNPTTDEERAAQSQLLEEVGSAVRGVATSSFNGFPSFLFNKLPNLEIISNFGVGVDGIDVSMAAERRVIVTNTPDVLTEDVADIALALMLSVSRRIIEADAYARSNSWPKHGMMPLTTKMSGKRVGILGMGRIGEAIAKRAEGFGCEIAYQSRSFKPHLPYKYFKTAIELAEFSHFLVIACPLLPSTVHIVDRAVMDAVGAQGVIINIARGPIVDEKELVLALLEGRLGGAGLDVFEKEPHISPELFGLSQVVLLPHVGSATHETRAAMADLAVANLKAHFGKEPLLTPIIP